jgi:hypothetical protein
MFSLCALGLLTSPSKFFVEPVVERKVTEPPSGPLYWRLENFGEMSQLARSTWRSVILEAGVIADHFFGAVYHY